MANAKATGADAGHGISFGEAFRVWLRVALLEFRRPGRTDRGDASHPGRGKKLDLREPLPACAELLHAAAGTGGAAAGDLYRLAVAPYRRRHHGRRPVHSPRRHRHHGPELRLCRLRQGRIRRGSVLRAEGRGAGDRDPGRVPRRQTRAAQPGHDRAGRHRLRRDLLLQRAVSRSSSSPPAWSVSSAPEAGGTNSPRSSTAAARTPRPSTACSGRNCPTISAPALRAR